MLDVSLTPQSIILLFPLIAVLAFLFVFVGPWAFGKVQAQFWGGGDYMEPRGPFFGGSQMDRRGPGPTYLPQRPQHGGHQHQTKQASKLVLLASKQYTTRMYS